VIFSRHWLKIKQWIRHVLWLDPVPGTRWRLGNSDLYVIVTAVRDGNVYYHMIANAYDIPSTTNSLSRQVFYTVYQEIT
jgi:hypothetical protein